MVEYIERGLPGSGEIGHKVHLFQSIELLASSIPLQQHPCMHCQRIQGLPRLLSRRSCFLRTKRNYFQIFMITKEGAVTEFLDVNEFGPVKKVFSIFFFNFYLELRINNIFSASSSPESQICFLLYQNKPFCSLH